MTPDSHFSPCPSEDGDELYPNGIFVFNITRMLEYLQSDESEIPVSEATVKDFPRYTLSSLNEEHIDTVDLEKPVIIAEISPSRFNVIDGNHRMEKARRSGVTTLPCYRVSPAVHNQFLTSQEAYDSYVDYWNGKVDEL